jgi:Na+-exporting ATPase
MLLLHGLVCRHVTLSIFQMEWRRDTKWLIMAILLGFILVIPTAYIPGLNDAFYQGAISWEWGIVIVANIIFLFLAEVYKGFKRFRIRQIRDRGSSLHV